MLRFLYVLLFFSFIGVAVGQPVGGWISANYGGRVTAEAIAGYAIYLAGLIWLINRINKARRIEVPVAASRPMSEMDFIRSQATTADRSDDRSG